MTSTSIQEQASVRSSRTFSHCAIHFGSMRIGLFVVNTYSRSSEQVPDQTSRTCSFSSPFLVLVGESLLRSQFSQLSPVVHEYSLVFFQPFFYFP